MRLGGKMRVDLLEPLMNCLQRDSALTFVPADFACFRLGPHPADLTRRRLTHFR